MSTPSIARPASGNPSASGAQVWSWTFPGAPICVNLSRYLVARLQSDLEIRTRALGDSAREIGGLLFGHQGRSDSVVVVDDYVWLPSEPTQNGAYTLNTAELERLRTERSGASSAVIGYFRTDFGANLELRDAEIDLVGRQFSEPTNIVLLIGSSRPHTGGFFFWMGEGVISPFSLMDFPLDVTRLPFHDDSASAPFAGASASLSELLAAAESSIEPPSVAPPSVVQPPASEPEAELVKWPVVEPVVIRVAPPAPVVQMPLKEAPVPPAPVVTIAQPPAEKTPPSAPSRENAAREKLQETSRPDNSRKDNSRQNSSNETTSDVASREQPASRNPASAPAAPSKEKSVWLTIAWTLALLIGLCLSAGVAVLVFRGDPLSIIKPSTTTESKTQPAPAFPFRLTVEAQGTGLNIHWDAQSPAVAQAHEGQLTITETDKQPVVIPLTAQQITIGHIYFQSSAERVEVQLETLDAMGKTSRESVLALSSVQRPPALPLRLFNSPDLPFPHGGAGCGDPRA